jgi:hypothetical protein
MYLALSIFLFAVCNTDVSRTFYININVFSIYIQKYSSPRLKTLQINENIMFSGARCLKHTQMVDGRVRVAGASLLHPADATACGQACQHAGHPATRVRRI